MKREFNVDANVGAPQVAYRETIGQTYDCDYTHKKQTGGSGQFADVSISIEPSGPGGGYAFADSTKGARMMAPYSRMRLLTEKANIVSLPNLAAPRLLP